MNKNKKMKWIIGIAIALLFVLAMITPFFLIRFEKQKEPNNPSKTEDTPRDRCYFCIKLSGGDEQKEYTIEEGYKFCFNENEFVPKEHYQTYTFTKKEDYDAFQPQDFEVELDEENFQKKIMIAHFNSYNNDGIENYVSKIEKEGFDCSED